MHVQCTLLLCCSVFTFIVNIHVAQLITKQPENITAALGTNATFSCSGNGEVRWEINGTQVLTEEFVQLFADIGVYVPLPTPNVSELITTATEMNNFTRKVICQVDPGFRVGKIEDSYPVYLLVYGEWCYMYMYSVYMCYIL